MTPLIPQDTYLDSELSDGLLFKVNQLYDVDAKLANKLSTAQISKLIQHKRVINAYYSNKLEDNPVKIDEFIDALNGQLPSSASDRVNVSEMVAHISVQEWLDEQNVSINALYSESFICSIHKQLMSTETGGDNIVSSVDGTKYEQIIPGSIRAHDVIIRSHIAPDAKKITHLFNQFTEGYNPQIHHNAKRVLCAIASHHRLAWLHPFSDGNGRVIRLHTDQALKQSGLKSAQFWFLSRELSKNKQNYWKHLALADKPRMGDRDGRGILSEQGLAKFCHFMLDMTLEHVEHINQLIESASYIN